MTIRVILVGQHEATRRGLSTAAAARGIELIEGCATGEEAIKAAPGLRAHVAVVDVELQGLSGIETIRRLRTDVPSLGILVLTRVQSSRVVLGALEAGASGYLLRDTPAPDVCRAIRQVREGLAPLSPSVARHVVAMIRERAGAQPSRTFQLTRRELQVLSLLVEGHSYGSIAATLGIQLGTVQTHMKRIYEELGVSSKTEAAAVARRHRLVQE